MDPATAKGWLEIIRDLGLGFTAATVLFIWWLKKGTVVWGTDCDAVKREREEWKHAALSGTGVLEKLTGIVERIEQRRL